MVGLEDTIRSSVPGGNIGKPLLLALVALLASGALSKGSRANALAGGTPTPPTEPGAGGLLAGLGGLLGTLEKGGLGNVINSWISPGPNQPVSPNQLGSALGPDIIKMLAQKSGLPEDELTRQLSQVLPNVVDKLTPAGRLPTLSELSRTI